MSTSPLAESTPRSPKQVKTWIWLALAMVMVVLLLSALIGAWQYSASLRVDAELAKIRQLGEPASVRELETFYSIADGEQNVTSLWLAGFEGLDDKDAYVLAGALPWVGTGDETKVPQPGEPWAELASAEAYLKKFESQLGNLHAAARAGGKARYATDFSKGIAMLLPHVQKLRGAYRLLMLEATCRAQRGDAHGAAIAIDTMLKLAASLEGEPILISNLVRIACNGMARQQLSQLLPQVEFAELDLAMLQDDLARIDDLAVFRRAILGERVLGLTVFSQDGPADALGNDAPPGAYLSITRRADCACYLNLMGKYVAATKLPWPKMVLGLDQAELDLKSIIGQGGVMGKMKYPLTALLVPALRAAANSTGTSLSQNRAATSALAVQRFRLRQGRLPTTWQELVPEFLSEVPVNPVDGLPLVLTVKDDECLVQIADGPNGNFGAPGSPIRPASAPRKLEFRIRVHPGARQASEPDATPPPSQPSD